LWTAVAGDRPVADAHDDPAHITWGWKDNSLGKKIWYYAKVIRKKATFIDLSIAPYFYALSKNFGNPVEDVQIQYYEGQLTREAKSIFDAILENGPMDTISIRKSTRMTTKDSNSPFERAMSVLQSDFKILPIGISDAGGWRYAFIYDLVHRYYPNLSVTARQITDNDARDTLLKLYFDSVGAAQLQDITKFFQWEKSTIHSSLNRLENCGVIIQGVANPQDTGEWFSVPDIL
jgi:hypothetical protein